VESDNLHRGIACSVPEWDTLSRSSVRWKGRNKVLSAVCRVEMLASLMLIPSRVLMGSAMKLYLKCKEAKLDEN